MEPIEIIVIIVCVLIVGSVIGSYIYKRIKHKPMGECADCAKRMKRAIKNASKLSKNKN